MTALAILNLALAWAAPLGGAVASVSTNIALLAYRPFLEPLPLDTYWLLFLPPLALVIALVYKAIKLDDLSQFPTQVASLTAQILAFMALAATALWLVTEIV